MNYWFVPIMDGGTLLPAAYSEIIQALKGGVETDGLTLIDTKAVVTRPELRSVNCRLFDGITQYMDHIVTGGTPTGVFKGEMTIWLASTSGRSILMDGDADFAAGRLEVNAGGVLIVAAKGATAVTSSISFPLDQWVYIAWDVNASSSSLTVNSTTDTGAGVADIPSTSGYNVGVAFNGTSLPTEGMISQVKVDNAFDCPYEEDSGDVAYDASGFGNHGTEQGATITTSSGLGSWNHGEGFSLHNFIAEANRKSFVILGDSLTNQNSTGIESDLTPESRGYFNWMRTYLSDMVYLDGNEGVASDTTQLVLNRLDALLVTYAETDYIITCIGINDIGLSVATATIISNIQEIHDDIVAAGITPIWMTIPPAASHTDAKKDALDEVNVFIETLPNSVDIWTPLAKTDGSRNILDGATIDGVHWGERGAELVGRTVAPTVADLIDGTAPYQFFTTLEPPNVIANPTFETDAGWTGSNATVLATEEDGYSILEITATADGTALAVAIENIASGRYAVGDRIRMVAELEWDVTDLQAEDSQFHPQLQFWTQNADNSWDQQAYSFVLNPSDETAGMDTYNIGSATVMTSILTVGALVDRLYTYVGFREARIDDVIKVKRLTVYDVDSAEAGEYTRIPALEDGTAAADGNPITNPAGFTHNVSECGGIQVGFNIVDSIEVSGLTGADAVDNGTYPFDGIVEGKPSYTMVATGGSIENDSGSWVFGGTSYDDGHATASGTFPDKTGWPVGAGGTAPTIAYDSFYVTSEEFAEWTYAQWSTQFTENGNLNLWVKKDANGNITRADQYPLSKVFTVAEATKNLNFYGTDGNILYDVGDEVVLDVKGFVVYTQ